jgi:hypothetical protein
MIINGEILTKAQATRLFGDMSQIADARESVMSSGKADGVRVIEVKTGSGLNFTVVPSRGLDIAWADYCGQPVAYMSKTGLVSPAYFEKDGLSFLRGFYCGLLTTCGLTYFGAPCTDQGEELGLHGRISNIPAQEVSVTKQWIDDDYVITIRGKIVESCVFRENLVLSREIKVVAGERKITISDSVENAGFDDQPFMLLYHCNFGYPIVSENSVLLEPEGAVVRPRDQEGDMSRFNRFESPVHGYREQVFYHDIPRFNGSMSYAALFNEKIRLGAYVKFNRDQFSHFGEWKMMGEGDYVVGLEPSTAYPEGRALARERGELEFIKPGEVRRFDFSIGVFNEPDEVTEE